MKPTSVLGDDTAAWLVLALGAAMVVGHVMALLKPPHRRSRPVPLGRSIVFIGVGALSAIWALASLLD